MYVVGECGLTMQEARCGECNALVGGAAHVLRGDNRAVNNVLQELTAQTLARAI